MSTIWFFESTNLFKIFCPHKYKNFRENHKIDAYRKNDYIYFEEDSASKVYLIEDGKVKIGYYSEDGEEVIKCILTRGEVFGEKAILGENRRTEFAQSVDNTTAICAISVNTMHELMRNNKTFSLKVYKFIGMRFKRLERRLELLLFKDTKTRLLEFFNELKEDYGHCCPDTGDMVIEHPYTQKDIASLIGTSRPTLNIIMNELKESQVIDFNRKEIRLKNVA
ncbi:Crp/Fnr family transcriptional regulator [Aquimarina hainanensis]|uniref:Crp/Fnr family transcriptional regulator n=1 Tax=Aquimarina hainanensis TaxID=1578017 RepID=A0ABW5N418_9FLAO|nr:Crp/Fnr family transcriptional regulator [Aquimarina sp. TRL1]QKX05800.1 Crp/Fnr family transcriptional regulator [Aquimarina sp. TRL1]